MDLNSQFQFYSCLMPGALMLMPHIRGSRVMGPHEAAQLETFHNFYMRRMMGRCRGTGGPSTAEQLDVTGQVPITQPLSHHRDRWLGHAARKPETTMVKHLLFADSIPGCLRPVGRLHYTWMDGAMQDLNTLGPRLQLQLDLLRDWPKLALDHDLRRGVASRSRHTRVYRSRSGTDTQLRWLWSPAYVSFGGFHLAVA